MQERGSERFTGAGDPGLPSHKGAASILHFFIPVIHLNGLLGVYQRIQILVGARDEGGPLFIQGKVSSFQSVLDAI